MSFPIAQFRFLTFVVENVEFKWQCSQYLDLNRTCGTETMDASGFTQP